MDYLRKISPRVSMIIYGAVTLTVIFFWLLLPDYSFSNSWIKGAFNGWHMIRYTMGGDMTVLGLLQFGNFVFPAIALILSLMQRKLNWLWTSIALGYFFTMGVVTACFQGIGLTGLWYLLFFSMSVISAFAVRRREQPAYL